MIDSDGIPIKFAQTSPNDDDSFIQVEAGAGYIAYFSSRTGFLNKLVSETETVKSKIKLIKYGTTGNFIE